MPADPSRSPTGWASRPGIFPAVPRAAPTIGRDPPGDVTQRMLAPMVLMLERSLQPDWPTIERFARELDPDGDWRHRTMPGADMLAGRGVRVMVDTKDEAVPAFVYEDSYSRSFWFKGDRGAIAAHRRHATVGCALDTSAADWMTIRQTAKVVTLLTGMLARLPGTIAVYNMDIGTIYEPAMVGDFLHMLGRDQIPVALWCWTQWHSMADGDVSMSTSGLTPLLGHEIETWNAPLTAEEVRKQASDIIIYLLDAGPTIGHGDTAGRTGDDQSIRCFFGPAAPGATSRCARCSWNSATGEGAAPGRRASLGRARRCGGHGQGNDRQRAAVRNRRQRVGGDASAAVRHRGPARQRAHSFGSAGATAGRATCRFPVSPGWRLRAQGAVGGHCEKNVRAEARRR